MVFISLYIQHGNQTHNLSIASAKLAQETMEEKYHVLMVFGAKMQMKRAEKEMPTW